MTSIQGRVSGLFQKYRVGRAARDIADYVEPTDELAFEDQQCGTWYGCRWKSHEPVLKDEGGACWWHNLCGHCGRRIIFKGSWDMGGEWIIDEHVIHEEAEI